MSSSSPVRRLRFRLAWWVFALLLVVPIAEVAVIVSVGRVIGAWPTVALLVAESLLGAWLVKREGARAWSALQSALATGRMPSAELADAALVLVGGTLLLTPGFLSDVIGFAAILPFTRPLARRVLAQVIARRLVTIAGPVGSTASGPSVVFGAPRRPAASRQGPPAPGTVGDDGVIEGEVL